MHKLVILITLRIANDVTHKYVGAQTEFYRRVARIRQVRLVTPDLGSRV